MAQEIQDKKQHAISNAIDRRTLLAGTSALTAASLLPSRAHAQAASAPAASLPARGEFVVRGAYVLSMDDKVGDFPAGDVHVREMFWDAGPKRTQQALADFLAARVADGQLDIPDLARAASQFFCLLKGELYALMMCGLHGQPSRAQVDEHITSSVDFFLKAYASR